MISYGIALNVLNALVASNLLGWGIVLGMGKILVQNHSAVKPISG
jgi:hypothetical protein